MRAVAAALTELYDFARGREVRATHDTQTLASSDTADTEVAAILRSYEAVMHEASSELTRVAPALTPAPDATPAISGESPDELDEHTLRDDWLYIRVPEVPLYAVPYRSFDAHTGRVPYGTRVWCSTVRETMIQIHHAETTGWIARTSVTNETAAVWPHFTIGATYPARDLTVQKLRLLTGDEFSSGIAGLPLTDAEYVAFRVRQRNHEIPWPTGAAPRVAGRWRGLLSDVVGVRVSATPRAGAIIEWTAESGGGRLGYVESVTPDETIIVHTVTDTRYEELHFGKATWESMAPTFILLT